MLEYALGPYSPNHTTESGGSHTIKLEFQIKSKFISTGKEPFLMTRGLVKFPPQTKSKGIRHGGLNSYNLTN